MSGAREPAPRDHAAGRAAARPPVVVRPVERRDLDRVWELVLALADYERLREQVSGTREALGEILFERPGALVGLVAEQRGRLVGYALLYPCWSTSGTSCRMWLEDLFVEPEARGTGAGRALLRESARLALERGCDRLDWEVLDWNRLAIDFYRGHGARMLEEGWLRYGLDRAGLRRLAGDS